MSRIGGGSRPDPTSFQRSLDAASKAEEAASSKARGLTRELAGAYGVDTTLPPLTEKGAPRARRAEEIARELLEQLPDHSAVELAEAWDEQRRLASTVKSFRTLCQGLGAMTRPGEPKPAVGFENEQVQMRQGMLQDVAAVRQALAAAGTCKATQSFPVKQLDAIEQKLEKELDRLESAAARAPAPVWSSAAALQDPTRAARVIGDRLGSPDLSNALDGAARRAADPEAFAQNLAGFAQLVEQATSAPDYAMTRSGWHNLWSRGEYRRQLQEPEVVFHSEERLDQTSTELRQAAHAVADADRPGAALERALVDGFSRQIGVHPELSKDWKITPGAVNEALRHETLVPLRALNETIGDAPAQYRDVRGDMKQVVLDVTRSIAEGRFREWRSGHEASREQLAVLSPAQRELWLDRGPQLERADDAGRRLATREEDGPELLWVTKIGGPSHGFDVGPHCLLPLLANARSRPILVDRSDYPENAIARSYLRLLEREDRSPVLYLEPLQCDKPNGQPITDGAEQAQLQRVILEHAMEKAAAVGVPLSITRRLAGLAEELGAKVAEDPTPRYVVAPSGGVTEASDTMFKHDWTQRDRQILKIDGRAIILPAGDRAGAEG